MTVNSARPDRIKIHLLNHLSYVIEAFAQDLPGEAKFELAKLIQRLETGDLLEIKNRMVILKHISDARRYASERAYQKTASCLAHIARQVWTEALEGDS